MSALSKDGFVFAGIMKKTFMIRYDKDYRVYRTNRAYRDYRANKWLLAIPSLPWLSPLSASPPLPGGGREGYFCLNKC
jgi:hypothetical protein